MPAQEGIWLHNVKGLFPGCGKVRKKDEPKAVRLSDRRFLDLPIEQNKLLAQDGVFCDQIGAAARQI